MPKWVPRAIVVFWLGFLGALVARELFHQLSSFVLLLLVSMFLALAIEPGVNRLARRGWRRGSGTALILFGVLAFSVLFIGAIGTLVGSQVADVLTNSKTYVDDTVDFVNSTFNTHIDPAEVNASIAKPDGPVQTFINNQRGRAISLSTSALGVLFQLLSVSLFTFYLVADGPKMRRAICSRLPEAKQRTVLKTWDLAIEKTGGYLYSRALLALISAFFHWIAFQAIGTPAPVAMALWVGIVSQFLPVVGTYLAGVLPLLLTFLDSPLKALFVVGFILVYQQLENYLFAPRITARTLKVHAAVAFGAAMVGGAVLGPLGAVMALPASAMVQALASSWGTRHEVIDDELVRVVEKPVREKRVRRIRKNVLDVGGEYFAIMPRFATCNCIRCTLQTKCVEWFDDPTICTTSSS
jgi:predicted PurR-regulated permease PerM